MDLPPGGARVYPRAELSTVEVAMSSRVVRLLVALLFVASVGACSSGGAAVPAVSDAWVRPPAGSDVPAAAYMTITNPSGQADALVSVSSPSATSVEMHETTTDMGGMTGMRPVPRIDVAAGGTVKLQPGGFHLMITGLSTPLQVGGKLELDLVFERAGKVVVQAEVRQG